MTTAIATPIDMKKLMQESAAKAMEQEKPDNKFVSFKSGVLSYNGNAAKDNKIQVIVVGSAFENQFFPDRYDSNKIVSPQCWAVSHEEDTLAPDQDACTKAVHTDCESCEYNAWESDLGGGKGKACKNTRRLGLMTLDQLGSATPDVVYARLPVTSVANWSKYVTQIGNVVKRPPWGVITEMSVVPDAKSQFKVNFQFMGLIEDEHLEGVHAIYDQVHKEILFGYPKNVDEPAQPAAKAAGVKGKKF